MKNNLIKPLIFSLFPFVFAVVACESAHAEIYTDDGVDVDHYVGFVTGMPDFDQRREARPVLAGLPNDGRMYCGPTAALNVLSYLGQDGYDVDPIADAELDWDPAVSYEPAEVISMSAFERNVAKLANLGRYKVVTALLDELGNDMDTDPRSDGSGTGSRDLMQELRARLPAGFDVSQEGKSGCKPSEDTITPRSIFRHFREGHLMIAVFGYYGVGDDGLYRRTGGHYVVPTGVLAHTDGPFLRKTLWWADPARDAHSRDAIDPATEQSAFFYDASEMRQMNVTTPNCSRLRWWAVDRVESKRSLLEAIIVIAPPGT
jgi:hypothetical protein